MLLVVKLQRVHLRTNQVVVHLLPHGPSRRVDRGQVVLVLHQPAILFLHRSLGIVGNAVSDGCLLKFAELEEQVDKILITLACGGNGLEQDEGDQEPKRGNRFDFVHGLSDQEAD